MRSPVGNKRRILIIDDDIAVLESCEGILEDAGYLVTTATDGASGLRMLQHRTFDLLLVDLKMPGMSGLEVLRAARESNPDVVVIIFTAYGTIETAVEAIKSGAFNYITKPFTAGELAVAVEKGLEYAALLEENRTLRQELGARSEGIVGESQAIVSMLKTLAKVAQSDASVLITGESGTGKELAARSIHRYSRRAKGPFVAVDCASIPESLLESELFGYERGAFTGAERRKRGLLEQADGGTLFLDEIGEMNLSLQARLLRALQERSFRRLGGEAVVSVDIRVISSTNRDLEREVKQGNFREDLLFRLNVVTLRMPPLRERHGDIALLCKHFLRKFADREGIQPPRISPEAMKALERYPWPGNVRELRNVIERAVVLNDSGVIGPADLPEHIQRAGPGPDPGGVPGYKEIRQAWIAHYGRQYLAELLERHEGNISQASREAGVSRKTFYALLKRFGLDKERPAQE